MTEAMQIFNKEEFSAVRVVHKDGEPWFIASDVAKVLGYTDAPGAIHRHCKKVSKISHHSPQLSMNLPPTNYLIIPESDVYRLILCSHLPNAKKFRKWVTSEVIPSIRKTGSYSMTAKAAPSLSEYLQTTDGINGAISVLSALKNNTLTI